MALPRIAWHVTLLRSHTPTSDGIKINPSLLQLYPSCDGIQHDQRRQGFSLLTKWLRITWPAGPRPITNPKTTLHPSVYERFEAGSVLHHDVKQPYRPEALRSHEKLKQHYANLEKPRARTGLRAYLWRYILDR